MMRSKKCLYCKQYFECPKKMGIGAWTKRKYCSKKCYYLSPVKIGKYSNAWKGKLVSYAGIHKWISNNFGKQNKCEFCGDIDSKKYEWANKSGKYLRDISDWYRLCCSCHRKYDKIWLKRRRDLKGRFI